MKKIIKKKNIQIYISQNRSNSNDLLFFKFKKKLLRKKNIYISGGKSLNHFLYKLKKIKNISAKFYLTDERLTNLKSKSNIHNIDRIIKKKFIEFDYHSVNKNQILNYCTKKLPNPDYTVMGIGEDGHIASIFKINKGNKKFIKTKKKQENFYRISMSEQLILKSREIYFYINNKQKNKYIKDLLDKSSLNYERIPFLRLC